MKKIILSIIFVGLSAFYVVSRTPEDDDVAPIVTKPPIQAPATTSVVILPSPSTVPPPTSVPKSTTSVSPTPTQSKTGYKDGVYTGNLADAYYGLVQVRATIQNGLIVDIAFLSYPNDRDTSIEVNSKAMPLLTQEAIKAQSAKVSTISGATETSIAFRESLATALSSAK